MGPRLFQAAGEIRREAHREAPLSIAFKRRDHREAMALIVSCFNGSLACWRWQKTITNCFTITLHFLKFGLDVFPIEAFDKDALA